MATQDHNDLLRAGQCPGAPFSLTDTLENRPQSPATQHTARHIEQLVHRLLSSWPGSSYYNKVIANFVPQRWSFACWGDQPRIYASLYVCARVYRMCADADQLRLLAVPYILESIKRVFQPLDIALTAHLTFRRGCLDDIPDFAVWILNDMEARWKLLAGCERVFFVLVKLEYSVIGI